jgi:hypothetical protein
MFIRNLTSKPSHHLVAHIYYGLNGHDEVVFDSIQDCFIRKDFCLGWTGIFGETIQCLSDLFGKGLKTLNI